MKKISAKYKFILLNVAVALALIVGIAVAVLYWLDNYTQHGHFIPVPDFSGMTVKEAHTAATQAHLRALVIDSLYDEDAQPGTVLEQYPAESSPVKEKRLIHLTINAHNPEKVVFPNLKNAAYRQTLQTLEARGFHVGHIEYDSSEFRNLVLTLKHNGEEIEPGSMLSKGSTIDIVLGKGQGNNTVYVPQLAGKKLNEAIAMIRKAYLNIGEITPDGSITGQTDRATATVYEQYPEIDHIVDAGTPVNLHITLREDKIAALDTLIVTE